MGLHKIAVMLTTFEPRVLHNQVDLSEEAAHDVGGDAQDAVQAKWYTPVDAQVPESASLELELLPAGAYSPPPLPARCILSTKVPTTANATTYFHYRTE